LSAPAISGGGGGRTIKRRGSGSSPVTEETRKSPKPKHTLRRKGEGKGHTRKAVGGSPARFLAGRKGAWDRSKEASTGCSLTFAESLYAACPIWETECSGKRNEIGPSRSAQGCKTGTKKKTCGDDLRRGGRACPGRTAKRKNKGQNPQP